MQDLKGLVVRAPQALKTNQTKFPSKTKPHSEWELLGIRSEGSSTGSIETGRKESPDERREESRDGI